MLRIAIAAVLAATLAGCGTSPAAPPSGAAAPSSSATATPSAGALYRQWSGEVDKIHGVSCAPATTKACADYLTEIVVSVDELERAIDQRNDVRPYSKTLAEIRKITTAGEAYGEARCYEASPGPAGTDACYGFALEIILGLMQLRLQLRLDDNAFS
jgi:hypothetical protein